VVDADTGRVRSSPSTDTDARDPPVADCGGAATPNQHPALPAPRGAPVARPGTCHHAAVERVSVIGNSGSGKTTLGRQLAEALDAPFVELDGIFHQPGWTELPAKQFRERVAAVTAGDRWVVDGNYSAVRDLVWERADTVVWLTLPRWLVTARVLGRTVGRGVRRVELWNGNREQLRNLFSRDPMQSIVLFSFRNHHGSIQRYDRRLADPAQAHLHVVRLRSLREVRAFLDQVRQPAT
jgi:adenylate kinase family enzyme